MVLERLSERQHQIEGYQERIKKYSSMKDKALNATLATSFA